MKTLRFGIRRGLHLCPAPAHIKTISEALSQVIEDGAAGLRDFFKKNLFMIGMIFFAGIYAFGFEIANFGMSIDEEFFWELEDSGYLSHILNQRPAMHIYYMLLPGIQYPFISIVFGLLVLSIAIAAWQAERKNRVGTFLMGALIISSPVWAHQYEFTFQAAYVCTSTALAVFAYLICTRFAQWHKKILIPLILITFSICTYQSIIFIPAGLLLVDCAIQGYISKRDIYNFLYVILISFLAFIIYKIVIFIYENNLNFVMYERIDDMFRWGKLPFYEICKELSSYALRIAKGDIITYKNIPLLIIPIIVYLLASNRQNFIFHLSCLTLLCVYCIFCYSIFGYNMPSRVLLFFPFIYGGLFVCAFDKSNIIYKTIIFLLTFYIFLLNSSTNTKLFMADAFAFEKDKQMSFTISNFLYEYMQNSLSDYKYVCIIGKLKLSETGPKISGSDREVFGNSLYTWDNGNPDRMRITMWHFGIRLPENLPPAEFEKDRKLVENIIKMPTFPKRGFIAGFGDILVIKLSDASNSFYAVPPPDRRESLRATQWRLWFAPVHDGRGVISSRSLELGGDIPIGLADNLWKHRRKCACIGKLPACCSLQCVECTHL